MKSDSSSDRPTPVGATDGSAAQRGSRFGNSDAAEAARADPAAVYSETQTMFLELEHEAVLRWYRLGERMKPLSMRYGGKIRDEWLSETRASRADLLTALNLTQHSTVEQLIADLQMASAAGNSLQWAHFRRLNGVFGRPRRALLDRLIRGELSLAALTRQVNKINGVTVSKTKPAKSPVPKAMEGISEGMTALANRWTERRSWGSEYEVLLMADKPRWSDRTIEQIAGVLAALYEGQQVTAILI